MSERTCKRCDEPIPPGKQRNAVYCSTNCQKRAWEMNVAPRGSCIDCGVTLGAPSLRKGTLRCVDCRHEHQRERFRLIERLWGEGRTLREIAERCDTSMSGLQKQVADMRDQGWDLPYRYQLSKPKHPDLARAA